MVFGLGLGVLLGLFVFWVGREKDDLYSVDFVPLDVVLGAVLELGPELSQSGVEPGYGARRPALVVVLGFDLPPDKLVVVDTVFQGVDSSLNFVDCFDFVVVIADDSGCFANLSLSRPVVLRLVVFLGAVLVCSVILGTLQWVGLGASCCCLG